MPPVVRSVRGGSKLTLDGTGGRSTDLDTRAVLGERRPAISDSSASYVRCPKPKKPTPKDRLSRDDEGPTL